MRSKFKFLVFLFINVPFLAIGQELEDEKTKIIEQRVDFLLDINEGGEVDFTTLFEQLEVFYDKPINLNTATKFELLELGLMSEIQINNLLSHLEKNGKLITIEELQSIDGFDLDNIRLIQPFTKVTGDIDQTTLSFNNLLSEGTSSLFIRFTRIIEQQEGFSPIDEQSLADNQNARYLGSPNKLFTRFRYNYSNNISFGFTAEKDAGEEFFKGSNKEGFDFYSAHLYLQNFGMIKQLAVGDFQAQFGQGLTFWSGLAFGRTPSIFTLKRNAPKLRPYTSVQEDLFLRGGGITLQKNNIEFTIFYSSKKVDANITSIDTLTADLVISSLSEDGFHRTPGEIEDENVVNNSFIGTNLSYEKRNFSLGLTSVYNEIGANFQPRIATYNKFSSLDNKNMNIGLDFSYLYRNLNVFGEVSKSIDGGFGYTLGGLVVLDPKLSVGFQHRLFEKDFKPIQSNAIGESTTNTNEKGTFIGIEVKPFSTLSFSAYADHFVFDWLRFQTGAPSSGNRVLAQLTYSPSRRMEVYFRFRQRTRGRNNNTNTEGLKELVEEQNSNYRLHFAYQITKEIAIKSRIEFTNYELGSNDNETGTLIYQDLSYKRLSFPLSFSIRYAIFDTESFNSRIYAYENDVLFAFSIPAYNGRGTRFYITAKYHIARGIDFWLRYAQTYYTDRSTIGSGKDEIDGNIRSEIKAQLRLKF